MTVIGDPAEQNYTNHIIAIASSPNVKTMFLSSAFSFAIEFGLVCLSCLTDFCVSNITN